MNFCDKFAYCSSASSLSNTVIVLRLQALHAIGHMYMRVRTTVVTVLIYYSGEPHPLIDVEAQSASALRYLHITYICIGGITEKVVVLYVQAKPMLNFYVNRYKNAISYAFLYYCDFIGFSPGFSVENSQTWTLDIWTMVGNRLTPDNVEYNNIIG